MIYRASAMKRFTIFALVITIISLSNAYPQDNTGQQQITQTQEDKKTTDENAGTNKKKSYKTEWLMFGSIPVGVLVWGLAIWDWGTASFQFEGDGRGLEQDSYTGGADKVSHAWGMYTISRAGSYIFENTGDSRTTAAFKGFLFGQCVGLGIEVGDGFAKTYGFSWGDMAWNFSGGVLALLMDLYPPLDNLIGFQMEYWPSHDYLNQPKYKYIEFTSDVTGQKFMLNLKLGGIPYAGDTVLKYFQIDFGYYTRGYWYHPSTYDYKTRHAYIGFAFNLSKLSEDFIPESGYRTFFSKFFKYYHAPTPLAYNPDAFDYEFAGKTPSEK